MLALCVCVCVSFYWEFFRLPPLGTGAGERERGGKRLFEKFVTETWGGGGKKLLIGGSVIVYTSSLNTYTNAHTVRLDDATSDERRQRRLNGG